MTEVETILAVTREQVESCPKPEGLSGQQKYDMLRFFTYYYVVVPVALWWMLKSFIKIMGGE